MATRQELKDLAKLRLREAEALFAAGLYDGCAYMCGYVVELALKAAICATLGIEVYPEGRVKGAFKTHSFDDLKLLAGLETTISGDSPNQNLFSNWSLATKWTPERRYEPQGTYNETSAKEILDAIRAEVDGVLSCISSRW